MADTDILTTAHFEANKRGGCWGPYWVGPLIGAAVVLDSNEDVVVYRTDDGGSSWSSTSLTTNNTIKIGAYFDKETPNNSGTNIHVWWIETASAVLKYRPFDISAGTAGTERTIATLNSGGTAIDVSVVTGCITRGGNLIVVGRCDATADSSYAYTSTDSGANWTSKTSPFEGNEDDGLIYPANTADSNDAALLYHDDTAHEISVKMWDDSEGTWTETSVATSITNLTLYAAAYNFDAAVRHSDGFIIVGIWNIINDAGGDLIIKTVDPDSIAAPSVASGTDVISNTANGLVSVAINQQNDTVYVAYKSGTINSDAGDVVFKSSSDGLSTWSGATTYSETASQDWRRISGPRSITSAGGFIQWSMWSEEAIDVSVNLVNDVAIVAAAGASRPLVNAGLVNRGLVMAGLVN